jgi:two-component SAPR family response regulator
LIVDENLGFVWWLGEILSKAGCTVVPALSCSEALSLSKQLSLKIDLIFVNTALSGSSAMVESLNRPHQPIRIIEVPASFN